MRMRNRRLSSLSFNARSNWVIRVKGEAPYGAAECSPGRAQRALGELAALALMDHETGVLKFILEPKRRRLAEQIANPKRRAKALRALAHLRDLDPRFAERIPPAQQRPSEIAALLEQRGAPRDCYVISEFGSDIDGKTMPLREALDTIVGFGMGTLISCLPGRLAYFEGEEAGERYILERTLR